MTVFSKNKQKKQDTCHDYLTTVNALRDKEVVSVCDGRRLGYVCDLAIDLKSGRILSLIIPGDRKSTRLNSSHEWISYAVFC